MTTAQINEWKAMAALGLIEDEKNPLFIFNMTHKDLLVQIAGGGIDVIKLARFQLRSMGLNLEGKFVGFNQSGEE